MNSDLWWDYFDEDPYEKSGRYMPDAFGNPIIVRLARISWAYLDWLDETYDRDGGKFFKDNMFLMKNVDYFYVFWEPETFDFF